MLARTRPQPDPRVLSLCSEFDITIVERNRFPEPGQTRAVATIARLIDKFGTEHTRLVLCVLAEGKGNHALINETSLWTISALLRACPDIVEGSTSAMLEMFDDIPLGPYMAIASELSGAIHQAHALAGMLYLHVRRLRDEPLTSKLAAYSLRRAARVSETEKDRPPMFVDKRTRAYKQAVARAA